MRASLYLLAVWLLLATGCAYGQNPLDQGRSALNEGRFTEARQLLRPLLDDPENRPHVSLYFDTFLIPGQYNEGLQEATRLLAGSPGDPYVLHAQGRLLEKVGRYQEAEQAFRLGLQHQDYRAQNLLALADLMYRTGRRSEARSRYTAIFDAYRQGLFRTAPELTLAARAAARVDAFHDANEAIRIAYRTDPRNIEVLYHWGELFREKYNEADAVRSYEEALALSAHRPELLIGLARSGAGFARQEELADRALAVNPNYTEALNLLAELRILDGLYAEAEALLQRALGVNPASTSTLAHLASVYHLTGDAARQQDAEQKALAINPRASEVYLILSENAMRRFRYPDAAAFARRAVAIERDSPQALAALGMSLLRVGQNQEAHRYLQAAFSADPFNLFAGNTLTLLEEHASFRTLESEHFVLLIHQSEADVLGEAVLEMAEKAFESMSARYPYRPDGKMLIEAYNDADDFAVRIAGVPHLGLLGVSFGDVVAINTPAAQSGTPYNWARTLWHEIAHSMAIGVSNFRVPRWFTEGLSVYEEQRAHEEWGREMELEFFAALDQGKLLPLTEIDRGFTRPTFPGQILLSYYHASRVISYVVDHFSFDAVIGVLQALSEGRNVNESFAVSTGHDLAALDALFRADLQQKRVALAALLSDIPDLDPESDRPLIRTDNPFFDRLRQGHEQLAAGNLSGAEASFLQALEVYPNYVSDGDPYRGLATIYRKQEKQNQLIDMLERFLQLSEHGAAEARELASLYAAAGDLPHAISLLERSLQIEPYEAAAREQLADLYELEGRYAEAVRHRRAFLALNPVDRVRAYYALASSLHLNRQRSEARRAVLQALEIAPGFRDAQRLLLQVVDSLD